MRPRVAVVGSGPAGAYAVGRLVEQGNVEVEVFDRLPTPGGLVRAGVAPDHPETKKVERAFGWWLSQPDVRLHLGVEIGRDVSAAELAALHHAVIYTSGASASRPLGIPGEDLPGSHAATDFVGWYNGHPDHAERVFDLSAERAVIVGNGNVALDVARIMAMDVDQLRQTDIADHALSALAESKVREIVVLGRRGPAEAAFTTPELMALSRLDGVDLSVEVPGGLEAYADADGVGFAQAFAARRKLEVLGGIASRAVQGARRRIVLRFLGSPVAIEGRTGVESLTIARNELVVDAGRTSARATPDLSTLSAGLVLRSVGYLGTPIEGVPFDSSSGRIPNSGGRVHVDDVPVPGLYAAGWIKRGPSGVIGTNKRCAEETVAAVQADLAAGLLPEPVGGGDELAALLAARQPRRVDLAGWRAIDAHERSEGAGQGRPRVKVCDVQALTTLAGLG